jgi:hypothetical protein
MLNFMKKRLFPIALWFSLITCPIYGSELLVLNPDDPLGGVHGAGNYVRTVGYEFTVGSSPLSSLSLGIRDWGGDGIVDYHDIGLWDANQNLLASVTITPGTSSNGWRFLSLTSPVMLNAGENYILGASYGDSVDEIGISRTWEGANPTYNSAVTFDTVRFDDSLTGLTFPTMLEYPVYLGEFGPNMEFEIVPEPSSRLLLLFGFIFIVAHKCRGHLTNRCRQRGMAASAVAVLWRDKPVPLRGSRLLVPRA